MLIFAAGLLGVVALPFLILMLPVMLWLVIPTAVFVGAGYAIRSIRRHQEQHGMLMPLQRT